MWNEIVSIYYDKKISHWRTKDNRNGQASIIASFGELASRLFFLIVSFFRRINFERPQMLATIVLWHVQLVQHTACIHITLLLYELGKTDRTRKVYYQFLRRHMTTKASDFFRLHQVHDYKMSTNFVVTLLLTNNKKNLFFPHEFYFSKIKKDSMII